MTLIGVDGAIARSLQPYKPIYHLHLCFLEALQMSFSLAGSPALCCSHLIHDIYRIQQAVKLCTLVTYGTGVCTFRNGANTRPRTSLVMTISVSFLRHFDKQHERAGATSTALNLRLLRRSVIPASFCGTFSHCSWYASASVEPCLRKRHISASF